MKVRLMLSKQEYNEKPKGFEICKLQGYISKTTGKNYPSTLIDTEIGIEDLANGLCNGMTCKPAVMNGSKSECWLQQQVYMLDFDHDTTIEEQLTLCKELNIVPAFGYTSFSHSDKEHHFRLVFIADTIITDIEVRDKLQQSLIEAFPKSDKVTFDPTRMFFGGKGKVPIIENYEARINTNDIINRFYSVQEHKSKYGDKLKKRQNQKSGFIEKKAVSYSDNVDAISNLDIDKMKALLKRDQEDKIICHSNQEVYDSLLQIDLVELLGIRPEEKIRCILHEHEDIKPSACVWMTDCHIPIYKCFGCGKALTVIALVEKLARCSRSKAIEFLKAVFCIEYVQTEWTLKWKEIMIQNALYLDTEEFKIQYPKLNALIRTRKLHIQHMLLHFSELINEEQKIDDIPIFFSSYTQLQRICECRNRNQITQSIILSCLLHLLTKVDPTKIPEKQLEKARKIAAEHGFSKITNFYQCDEYGYKNFEKSEQIAKELKQNHMTLGGLSREYIMRTFPNEANRIFPQFIKENAKGTTKKSNNCTLQIAAMIKEALDEKGYIKESEIKTTYICHHQWKRSIQEILDTYGLLRIKASSANKQKYGITDDKLSYQSFIIVKDL